MKRVFDQILKEFNVTNHEDTNHRIALKRMLKALDQLEIDFAILCKEAARSQFNEERGEYDLSSGQFDEMLKRREIELPY
jgi:hypothetical protein